MEITNMNTALSAVKHAPNPSSIQGAVSMKLLDKSLDMSKEMGDGIVKMMENSVNPHLGGNIDVSV